MALFRRTNGPSQLGIPAADIETPAPPTPSTERFEGYIDLVDGSRIVGWIHDRSAPGRRLTVEVQSADGVYAALADRDRADLRAAGKGDGRHGFEVVLDHDVLAGVVHVREAASGWDLAGSPVNLDLPQLLASPINADLLEALRYETRAALLALEGGRR